MKKIFFIILLSLFTTLAFCQTKPAKKTKKRDTITIDDRRERRPFAVKFSGIFQEEPNGDFTALYPFKIDYYTIPVGGNFPERGSIGGVTLDKLKGHILLVDTVKGTVIYKGVYHN